MTYRNVDVETFFLIGRERSATAADARLLEEELSESFVLDRTLYDVYVWHYTLISFDRRFHHQFLRTDIGADPLHNHYKG